MQDIIIDGKGINDVYIGGKPIEAAFIGGKQIWPPVRPNLFRDTKNMDITNRTIWTFTTGAVKDAVTVDGFGVCNMILGSGRIWQNTVDRLVIGRKYTFSCMARNRNSSAYFTVESNSAVLNNIRINGVEQSFSGAQPYAVPIIGTEYKFLEVVFTPVAAVYSGMYLSAVGSTSALPSQVYRYKLEQGNRATPWIPNVND